MRMPALLATALFAAVAVAQDKPKEPADRVKELRKERVAILKEAAEISHKMAMNSRLEMRVALDDRLAALKAELETVEKEEDRAALRKLTVETLKELEAIARAHFERGTGTKLDVLRVQARRLEVELQFEQEKANRPK